MSEKTEKKAIQLSDSELNEVSGGNAYYLYDGNVYYCSANVPDFDTLSMGEPPINCAQFTSKKWNCVPCCGNCDHCHNVPEGELLPGNGGNDGSIAGSRLF